MINGTFSMFGEPTHIVIDGNNFYFIDDNGKITTLEGLKFDFKGVIKEFPDLEKDDEWKKKAIDRLKEHIKSYKDEVEKLNYVRSELEKFGYKSLYYQRAGFRPQKFT